MASSGSLDVVTSLDIGSPQLHRAIPRLDVDVLQAICSSIAGVYDLLSVSQTCSLMWRIATREILRTHTIRLTSSKAILSFRMFILNHKATHAHHVRSLAISGSDATTDVLMDILDCTAKLDSLHLSLTASQLLVDPARIAVVFAGLSALTSLSLKDPGQRWTQHTLDALPVQAPLRTLSVNAERNLVIQPALEPGPYFRTFLRFSTSSTLTSLRLDQVPIYDDSSFPHLPQFHSVRSLAITGPLERAPRLAALLHLFPSLDGTLYLRQSFRTGIQLFIDPSASNDAREQNRRAQDVFRWAGLDRLDCNAEIAGAVEAVQPNHLVVASLLLPFYLGPAELWRTRPAHPYLTHLVLIWSFHSHDSLSGSTPFPLPDLSADIAFERLVQTISLFSSATHVRLVFYCDKKGPSEEKLERFMRDIRARLLTTCPRLRYFFVTAAGRDSTNTSTPAALSSERRWNYARAWRVVGPGERGRSLSGGGPGSGDSGGSDPDTPVVEELCDSVARRVIEDEGLGLPEEREVGFAFVRL